MSNCLKTQIEINKKMNENERNSECNAFFEDSVAPTIGERTMKYGWYKTLKNTVHYYQTPFDIALILEQVSKHNVILIEKIRIEKDIRMQQHDMIGNVKIVESKLSAKAKECMYETHEEKKNDNNRNETMKENEWLTPKKGVTMKHVCEIQGMKENENMNNNKRK